MANEKLEVAIVEDGSGTKQLIDAVNKLAAGIDDLGLRAKKGATEVKSQGDAAKKSAGDNDYLTKALGGAKSAFSGLSGALAGVTSLLSVSKLVEYADKYTSMSGKLRLVTTDQQKLNGIIEQAYGIAQRNSTSLASTTELYGKLSSTVQALGGNQKDVAGLTETVTQAIALTGATAEEAENGLRQFNQGLSSGALRGDEFNSVLENIPGLAKAIAAGIGTSGAITTGELRKMAEEGKLTGKAITDALKKVAPDIATLAAGLPDTVSKAMQRLDNAFLKFIGQNNEAYGVTQLLAKGIGLVANNINIVVPAMLAFVAVLGAGAFASAVGALAGIATGFVRLAGAVGTATIAMLSNPLILAGTLVAIAAVTAAVKLSGLSFQELAAKAGSGAQTIAGSVAAALGLTGALAGVPAAAGAATAAVQANGNANVAAATAQTANTAATVAAVPAQQGFIAGLVAQAAAVNNSVTAKTADTAATTANTAAKAASVTTQQAVTRSVFEGIDAQTRVGQALSKVTVEHTKLSTQAASTFEVVKNATAGALPGFDAVKQAGSGINSQFLEVSMTMNRVPVAVQAVGTAVMTATPQMQGLGTAVKTAATSTLELKANADGTTPALAALGDGTGKAQVAALEAAKANGELSKSLDGVSTSAQKALDNITAAAKGTEDAGKAASDYAARLEKLSGAYNQYGEKLEDVSAIQQRNNQRIQEGKQYLDGLLQKMQQGGTSASSLSSGLQSVGTSATAAGSAVSTMNGYVDQSGQSFTAAEVAARSYAAAARDAASASADATAKYNADRNQRASESGYNSSLKETIRNSSSNTDGGQFGVQTNGFFVKFNGLNIGSFQTGYYGYNADVGNLLPVEQLADSQQKAQRAVDAAYAKNPLLTVTEAMAIARANANSAYINGISGYAHGGQFTVGGNGGTDSQHVQFMASPNEVVTVETPAQRNKRLRKPSVDNMPTQSQPQRPGVFIMNVRTNDVDAFKRTRTQTAQDMVRRLNKG